jgi:hypothetical protein
MKKTITAAAILAILQVLNSCQLNEEFEGTKNGSQVGSSESDAASLLIGAYNSMRGPFEGNVNVFALSEVTTDERIMPTRGPDWDDNGVWRALHQHQWDANHSQVVGSFNGLNGIVYSATDLLRFNPSAQQAAEARFLRAYAMYWELDLFDQVPYREPGESVLAPAKVRKGTEALTYIISELTAIQKDLPDGRPGQASKDAARALLMKCYLNKGVYANRSAPTFDAGDMNMVVKLADEIISSNRYSFPANYFDNFAPNNSQIGKENIFTDENIGGTTGSDMSHHWFFVSHYKMNPSGYNGPCTSSEFYDKFEATDKRRGVAYSTPGGPPNPGMRINVGFLAGQQYDLTTDAPLTDRSGAALVFTKEVKIIETGRNLEVTGIRPIKYVPDMVNGGSYRADNDLVRFRLADILLMKAEAILRGGTGTSVGSYGSTPLEIVNAIRTDASRGASALASLTLDALIDERGRELWNEMWRRQDLIRFGKFLKPFQEKTQTSAATYLIFPIPNEQLAVNPLLSQNPGY